MFPIDAFRATLTKVIAILQKHQIRFHLTGGVTSVAYGEHEVKALLSCEAATCDSLGRKSQENRTKPASGAAKRRQMERSDSNAVRLPPLRGSNAVCIFSPGTCVPGYNLPSLRDLWPDGNLVVEALWIAEFVPLSEVCTGKFEGVTGSWIMFANSEPFVLGSSDPVYYEWEGDGSLTFQKQK